MEPLIDIRAERERLITEIRAVAERVAPIIARDLHSIDQGTRMLTDLRSASHEDTNQLLRQALVLDAADELAAECEGKGVRWSWKPLGAMPTNEPDLQGVVGDCVAISMRVTAGLVPQARPMDKALKALSGFGGRKLSLLRGEKSY